MQLKQDVHILFDEYLRYNSAVFKDQIISIHSATEVQKVIHISKIVTTFAE